MSSKYLYVVLLGLVILSKEFLVFNEEVLVLFAFILFIYLFVVFGPGPALGPFGSKYYD